MQDTADHAIEAGRAFFLRAGGGAGVAGAQENG